MPKLAAGNRNNTEKQVIQAKRLGKSGSMIPIPQTLNVANDMPKFNLAAYLSASTSIYFHTRYLYLHLPLLSVAFRFITCSSRTVSLFLSFSHLGTKKPPHPCLYLHLSLHGVHCRNQVCNDPYLFLSGSVSMIAMSMRVCESTA